MNEFKTLKGSPYLLGAVPESNGCNFAIFCRNGKEVTLHFFHGPDDKDPLWSYKFDETENRTGDIWHVFVENVVNGQLYGYTIDGEYTPEINGSRYNVNKLLIDPYTRAVIGEYKWKDKSIYGYIPDSEQTDLSFNDLNDFDKTVKSSVIDCSTYDWEGDRHINIPMSETIIYEMHVRGFTCDKSSGVKNRGTFKGVGEKSAYLKNLGITTVELLPIMEFNETENIKLNPVTGERLYNFWGYSTLSFFAPNSWYASEYNGITAVREFKDMVKELHKHGIEVIIDVVYNHTGEGNEYGPTISFKGIDNKIYYMLENNRYYKNYSGCGNTVNCNHTVVRQLIIDSLRYWYTDMHVDGFRFDLAAILGRDTKGGWIDDNSLLNEISDDPILRNAKIIAEVWDAAGLYKLGDFPQGWSEWNGKYRDSVRSLIKGDEGVIKDFALRIAGSPDIFQVNGRKPHNSINFITSHDGFTMMDLVSYNNKKNEENGENNNDGDNNNNSWNCGNEGDTDNNEIKSLRLRQIKNFFTILMISHGTPMIHHGDEFGFSKKGNNNTYCHDNDFNHLDWKLLKTNRIIFDFCKSMIEFRKSNPLFRKEGFFDNSISGDQIDPDIMFYDPDLTPCRWEWFAHSISILYKSNGDMKNNGAIFVCLNTFWEDVDFILPHLKDGKIWKIKINTYTEESFFETGMVYGSKKIKVKPRSIVILVSETK